jgi:hypothetical protein
LLVDIALVYECYAKHLYSHHRDNRAIVVCSDAHHHQFHHRHGTFDEQQYNMSTSSESRTGPSAEGVSESNRLVETDVGGERRMTVLVAEAERGRMAVLAAEAARNNILSARILPYPRDFFCLKEGTGPKTPAAAALLWGLRKNRPQLGAADTEAADGQKMMIEMKEIRGSLREWTMAVYKDNAKKAAKEYMMIIPGTNQLPVTIKDLINAVVALEPTEENYKRVWMIFFEFHRNRDWLCTVIDMWFVENNMVLTQLTDEDELNPAPKKIRRGVNNSVQLQTRLENTEDDSAKAPRKYKQFRGGFSRVATQAKAQVVKRIMLNLRRAQGWYLSTGYHNGIGTTCEEIVISPTIKCWLFKDITSVSTSIAGLIGSYFLLFFTLSG